VTSFLGIEPSEAFGIEEKAVSDSSPPGVEITNSELEEKMLSRTIYYSSVTKGPRTNPKLPFYFGRAYILRLPSSYAMIGTSLERLYYQSASLRTIRL